MNRKATLLFFLLVSTNLFAQNRKPAFDMNERLGRGINMGNAFEAPSEAEWGNPWKPEYFRIIAELGFDHVRLPVRWEPAARSNMNAPYTITPAFLQRIQQVVDTALRYGLHIIVNMHHHEALYENPASQKQRFLSQWRQIAEHFQGYPDKLLFEVLNEPHGNLNAQLWNEYFADALAEIRKTNPTRVVLMGVADYGGLRGISKLVVPNDEYIILSPHYYNPFHFTHQGAGWVQGADAWLGTEWNDTEADRQTVENDFKFAQDFAAMHHLPIHVGEFGAFSSADIVSRQKWTTFLTRWFEENNMSWAYWEFSAGFGIYNRATKSLITPLVDALLHNAMPEPIPVTGISIYESNFSNGADGWTLNTQSGATGSLAVSDSKLNITVISGGAEAWHVQLVRSNLALEKDKSYRISFKAKASPNCASTFYAGKASASWNAYSGYNGLNVSSQESTFLYSFKMTNGTDQHARLVFDLGIVPTKITIWDVIVEQLSVGEITGVDEEESGFPVVAYPNPLHSVVRIDNAERYTSAEIYDWQGKYVRSFGLSAKTTELNFATLAAGFYIIKFIGSTGSHVVKVLKEDR